MWRSSLLVLFAWCSCISLIGCGGGAAEGEQAGSEASEGVGVKEVTLDKLKPLGDPMPELDNGRILITPPKDWHTLGRNAAYLAAFSHAKGSQLPLITVKTYDPKVSGFESVTSENVLEYATAVQAALASQYGEKLNSNIAEQAKPMKIGENAFARYVKNAKNSQGVALHVQVLETVQGGRAYAVELQVVKGAIVTDRDFAYAVAGGLKFLKGSASPPASTTEKKEEPKEAPKEAEAKPAEEEK
jgi:hypothetical protein